MIHDYASLKYHVNKHFLFNCFNTLSSLISEDRQRAEAFLNDLSKVYRYVFQCREDSISTVANEILFINSYYALLQTRHGSAVQFRFRVEKLYEPFLLPALSLQLLVENVLKHNILSKTKPLTIEIFATAGNKLIVSNNLQRRCMTCPATGVGLDSIAAKYEQLKIPGFLVREDEKNFTVELPLIPNCSNENKQ